MWSVHLKSELGMYVVTVGHYTGIYPEWYLEFTYQHLICSNVILM